MAIPLPYDEDIADLICEKLATGKSLVTICQAEDMPSYSTVMKWLRQNEQFAQNYALAREAQADYIAEDILNIADDATNDTVTTENGQEIANSEWISRSRLRVDARKWYAGKLQPKKYGDKQEVALTVHKTPLKKDDEDLLDAYHGSK